MDEQENTTLFSKEDIEKNKGVSALAYILFFMPLILCYESPFGKFHANQGLILFITAAAGNIVLRFIPVIGWMLSPLFSLLIFILAIIGIINAVNGKAEELPVIGKYRIIK